MKIQKGETYEEFPVEIKPSEQIKKPKPPTKNSKKAPPAVDKCVNDNCFFILFIAEIVSPPPSTDIKDLLVVFREIFSAIELVP